MTYTYNNKTVELNTQSEFSAFCDQIKLSMNKAYDSHDHEYGDAYAKILMDVQQLAIHNLNGIEKMKFIAISL